jgi:hypothetical protein
MEKTMYSKEGAFGEEERCPPMVAPFTRLTVRARRGT